MKYPAYRDYRPIQNSTLERLPLQWQMKRLKFIAEVCNGRDQKEVLDDNGPYLVYGSGGPFGCATDYLYDGVSVLLGRKGTIDKPLLVREPFWTVDTMFYTRIAEGVDPRYFYYLCTTIPFDLHRDQTTLPSMTQTGLADISFSVAPQGEQAQIADFLDWRTAQIDALIAKKQALLERLSEKRSTLITQGVTRGMTPNVELHETGSPWIPKIPAHWTFMKFGHCTSIAEGQVNPEEESFRDLPLVAPNHIEAHTGKLLEVTSAQEQGAISGKYLVRAGDLVYSKIRPHLNKCALVNFDALCSADAYPIRTDDLLLPQFLKYWMLARPFLDFATESSMRVAMPKINRETLNAGPLAVPPVDEQAAIVEFIEAETSAIDLLASKAEIVLSKLFEYRSALITAAVTGQIDVRGVKVPAPV